MTEYLNADGKPLDLYQFEDGDILVDEDGNEWVVRFEEVEDPRIGEHEDAQNAPVSKAEADAFDRKIYHYPDPNWGRFER